MYVYVHVNFNFVVHNTKVIRPGLAFTVVDLRCQTVTVHVHALHVCVCLYVHVHVYICMCMCTDVRTCTCVYMIKTFYSLKIMVM